MINEIEDKNNRRNLYEALKGDFDLGTAEQFEKSMQSAEARKNLWNAIHEDYDVGTFEQFEKDMMGDKVKPEQANHSQPTNAQPNQPQPQQPQQAQFQQSLPITSKVGQTEQGNKQIAQVHNQQSSSQAMPPQATMNAPQPRQQVMSLNDRQKLWTWRNIKPTLSTGQTEQQYNARWNNEVENVKRRNDPDEIAAFNAFQKELAQQQAKVQQQGHAVVETGNQPFQSESGTEVWPISFSRKTIPHNQDYVFTLRAMQQAKGTYDLQYNIKDPEIRRDYEALTAPTDDTYRPTDAILDASPREKNKYYQWYAAYLYSNGGEMPEWLDYTAQLKLRSLNKSNLESEAKQWINLVERTRNARKFRGSNSVSDWLNEQYNFKSGDPRIINGASYPYLVTRAGLIQTPLVQTTGRATVADNRRAYNELLQSNEQSKANPAQGDVYSTSNIINPERFWANTTKWQDLSESQKAAYKDEADYYNQMLKGQANVGYYNVGNGQNEEVEFLKHNRKQMNEQYNMLTDKERTQAVMKQAERTLNVLNGISHNLNTKLRFSIMGKGVEEDNGIRSVIRRYEKFLEVAPRYLEKRNYSAALQFWNGLTDLNGLTFGLLGVADAVSLNKIANNPPKDLIEKFGVEANAKKVIATAIQLDNMAEEYRQKLDYYGTGYSLGGLTQFGIQAGLPLFKGTEAVGKILTGGMRGLVKKATLRYMPNTAKRLGAKELVQTTLAEGTRQAMREGGIGGAAGYVAGRLGVANGVSTIVGKAAQGSVEGVVLSVPHAIANVTNNRTGQANVVEINREGIKVNDQPFTHMNQAPDGKVEADTMLREWSQWVGMRVGEVFMPFSKYVDGKVANVAKGAWNKSVGRFIDGSSFARITETFNKVANVGKAATEVGKYVSGNLKRAGMGGTLTFYAQTNLSEMLNAMTVGDVSWDDIKSDQLDKLWGAFVSNAYLVAQNNLVGTVGYYNQKSNLNKSLAQYDAQGSAAWGETDWNGIKADVDRLIDNDKNLQAYQNGVLANENLSKPQRETISQYIATRKTLQAFDLFAKVGNEKSKPNEFDIRYNDAYIAGTQVKSPDQMAQMRESLDASRNTLANLLGIKPEQVDALFADTNKSLGQIYEELTQQFVDNEKANLPNGQSVNTTNIEPIKRAIDHYCTALSMQRGVSESLITSQLEAVQKLDAKVDAATNKDSGMIERATDDMGRECYVISGNADSSNNTDMVVVRYTEDGRVASLSPKQVTIIQQTDAHELKQKNADLVDLNYEGILNSIVNGKTLPEPNDQVVLYDGKSRGVATIEGIKYEESTKDDTRGVAAQPKSVVVKTEDGRIIELPIDTYRQWVRDGFKHDTEVYVHGTENDNSENTNKPTEGTENATEAPTLAEGLRVSINGNEYTIGKVDDSRVELIDENGKDFHWTRSALDKKLMSGDAEILASNEENAQQKPELHYGDEVELNDPDNGENIRGKVNSRDASDEVEIVTDDGRVLRYSKRELDNVIQNVYNNGEHIWSKDENKTEEASNETDTEQEPQPIGKGVFGNIYDQFKGKAKEAINFLKKLGSGEAVAALHHKEVGDISLVWGNDKAGLKKILRKHPEVVDNLQGILDGMHVVQSSENRIILESDTHKAVVSREFDGTPREQWLLTAYEKKNASGGSIDIVPEPTEGKQNGTAPLQDILSADKVTEQSATAQAEATQNEPMPMHTVGKGKNAVQTEDWLATTPKRGFDYIFGGESGLDADEGREFVNNKLAEAQKNLDKVKNGKPKMGTSIAAYKEAKEAYTTRVEDAQKAVDYWQSVKAEHDKVLLAERHARDEKDKALHEQAVAEEQQRMQDDARKATEQAELGSNAVAPTIRDKWNAAKKENGDADEITLPNGEVVKGHYVLTESGAASASHQATNGFAETEGFPIDENGQSVNDRDYKRDQEAQQVTRSMATDYDQRALQSPVVVSQEGVVLSGNGRTMAGELAAQDGTDTKYVDYLHSHANKFGFTPEQVNGFKHPRVVFVPNEAMPYNADTFAKFNQREQKSQNNTEMAVKMGKVVNDALFGRIMDMVSKYDTLGEFYADDNATYAVVKQLAEADIIPQTEMAHLFDGGKLSEAGQSMIEGVMIGKVFQANPDAVRQITEVKSMRQAVMTALQDIVQNNRLGGGYNLSNELAEAVNLVYRARKAGYKLGQHVSDFAHQGNLFEYDEGATVADFNNMAVMMLADVLNDGRSTQLKKVIAFYNEQATDAAQGIGDMFVGGVKSKTEIINEVNKALNNGREYNTTATSLADGQGQRNQSSKQSNDVGTSGTDGKPTNDTSAVTAETDVESGATEGEKSSAKGDVVPSGNGDTPLSEKIATASAEVNTEPTEAQKEAGNYKKGHVQVGTFDITIEQPQGSVRKGTDADGKQWESKMNNTYGYIRGAVGVDGDHIDVFLSNDIDGWNGRKVFVVDQYNPDGSFDEHKVMLGFNDADEAKSDYLANYEKGWENGRRIDVTAVNLEDFEKWIASSKRKTKPFGEYSSVKNGVVPSGKGEKDNLRMQKVEDYSAIDAEYFAAVERGDLEEAQRIVNEVAKRAGYSVSSDYQGTSAFNGAAPYGNGYFLTKEERKEAWDNGDFEGESTLGDYIDNGVDGGNLETLTSNSLYRHADDMRKEAIENVRDVIENGRNTITMYRSVPSSVKEGKFRNGDWITPSRKYAEDNAELHGWGKDYRVIEQEVPVDEVWFDGNDIAEWGYGREEDYVNDTDFAYKNTKNNRKLLDVITRDDEGNIIPPSKRFNSNKADERYQKANKATQPSKEEVVLRDAVIDHLRENDMDVITDEAEGQSVLDMANGRDVRLSAKQKRALETATIADESTNNATVVSSAAGAKVQNNLEILAEGYQKRPNKTKGFITDLSRSLGLKQHESSQYGTFVTGNGKTVTIRVSNHNARVSNFDRNGENDGISIVISSHKNKGLNNDGDAHVTEFFYPKQSLERAGSKPLSEVIRSVSEALNSGVFKDTTGLAERQEVNNIIIREHRVYHGSGAEFDAFDHSHMGEGEGAQAFGWGTYVTEVEGIGRTYAESASKKPTYLYGGKEMSSDEFHDYVLGEIGDWNENMLNDFMYNLERHGVTRAKDILKKGDLAQYKKLFYQSLGDTRNYAEGKIKAARTLLSLKGIRIRKHKSHLYTIEIPDDNGKNYLDWNGHPAESLLKDVGSFLESNGFEMVQDSPARYEKGESTIVLNPNATGADLYAELQEALGSDKEASKALSEIGLTGIKYPADYIRGGREDGAKNYVIFNENDAKITDHVRFFKTKNGEAYGFTIGGKIYIDPKVATSETPVHEYAHLWASALKANNAKEWQNVVGLMKGTSVWEEVKKLYPELKSDDEIADEVLATYSGRRGAERLRKEMDDIAKSNGNVFDKATAMSALHRVKQAIEKFWHAVADFLHIHYISAEQVADQVMKDLLNGVDPRKFGDTKNVKEIDNVRYSLKDGSEHLERGKGENGNGDKTLAGVHNITEDKLRKALKLGGLANPSVAVIDTEKQGHSGYGEISLILPSQMVAKRTGRNAGTFFGDAWTPTYPQVERIFGKGGSERAMKDIESVPDVMKRMTRNAIDSFMDGRGTDDLSYLYLMEQGKAPNIVVSEREFPESLHKEVNDVLAGKGSFLDASEEERKAILSIYVREKFGGNMDEYAANLQEKIHKLEAAIAKHPKSTFLKYRQLRVDDMKQKGYDLDALCRFVDDLSRDEKNAGKPLDFATMQKARDYIKENGLQKDFEAWVNNLSNRYNAKEVIFDGFTPSGKRKYVDNNLVNVSRIMKRKGLNGSEGFGASFNNFAATIMQSSGTLKGIKARKQNLTSNHDDVDAFTEKWSEVYNRLADVLNPNSNIDDYDVGYYRLEETALQKDPKEFAKKEYGVELSEEDVQQLKDMVKSIREERPAMYFETKFERPVTLDEFAAAVVPNNLSADVRSGLEKAGIKLYDYDPQVEGDRKRAFGEAVHGSDDVLFRDGKSPKASMKKRVSEWLSKENLQWAKGKTREDIFKNFGNELEPIAIVPSGYLKYLGNGFENNAVYCGMGYMIDHAVNHHAEEPVESYEQIQDILDYPDVVRLDNRKDRTSLIFVKKYDNYKSETISVDVENGKLVIHKTLNHRKKEPHKALPSVAIERPSEDEITSISHSPNREPASSDFSALDGHGKGTDFSDTTQHFRDIPKAPFTVEEVNNEMAQTAKGIADEMNVGDNVDVLTSTDGLTGRKKNAKGWYDPQTGRITIVLPNHNGRADVVNTMLHEAVGHYGLRELVGKEKMNEFLDFVFKNADKATRSQIAHNSAKYGWDMRKATEEYMASMAEDGTFKNVNKRWWHQLKLAFLKMLHKLGFAGFSGTTLSDNDLRYLLWRSWKNLTEGPARNIYQVAEDTWRQQHLKVGDFAEPKAVDAKTREQNLYYREERERKSARDEYERSVNTAKHKMNLAWVDSMSGLKLLQDAIVPNEKDLKDWENAYMAENRMSSTNLAEMETYKKSFYKDLLDAEQELLDKGAIHEQVTNYMMEKHGLERNEVLAFRDALKHDFANDKQKMSAAWKAYKNDATAQQNKTDFESGKISWDDYKANDTAIREKYAPSYKKYRSKDYSGLTELTTDDPSIKSYQDQIATLKEQLNNERDDATKKSIRIKIAKLNKEMVNEAERIAENSSSNFEKKYDTSELWNRTNAATKASLTKQYESGLLTDEVYHHTLDMFKNYIPLRGFDDVTSDEVYNYFGNAKGQFGGGIRSAKGRKSKADDPIATIGNMAESAIMQGNRNQMKQHFLKMVLNHPSDAVSVDQLYLHYDAATQEWKPVFAEFDEHDDANAVAQKVEAFNQRMETLCQQKPDEYKKASEAHDIQYKVVGKNINEHQVHVKMQGKDYVLTINGNPEAAQALNGQTNPDSTDNPFIKFFQSTNHFMAAMFTQKNPAFILSNLSRDSFYANSMVWAKESPAYAWKFNKNWGKSLYTLFGLITRQRKGTLNMNDKVDRMYQEFIENGGETGYTFLHSVDDYKNMIAKALKEIRRSGWNPKSWLKFLDNLINYLGTWAENTSRFAAYRTSREMGRSIEKSIWDAKEISVNFNKKGAGAKAAGKWEDGNRLNVMQAYMSQSAKELYVFWNAGVQGLSNVSRTFGKSKGKTLAVAGLYFAIGTALPMLMAALSQGSGDDDTNYYDLPDWVRRNNLCFYTGKGWVTIPLPIELRAFYGLGELAQSVLSGNEEYTATDIATKMLEQVSQLFPVDFMEGGGSLTSFVPSYAKPIVEAYVTNKDYTGTPIYKDAEYNKNRPEWTKAYKGTNQALVWASRLLNELGGGDDVKKANVGVMDVNPAKIQHLFEGYFGGLGKFVFQTMKVASMPFNEDNRELKNVPIINSFYKTSDERTKDRAITSKFYKYNDEYQKTKELLSLYKKELQAPEYKSKFYDLMYSPEGFSATMMDSYNKQLSAVRKAMSVTDPNSDKYKELQQQQVDIQKQAVKVIEATKGVVNSEDKEMKELYNLWMQDYSNDPKKAEERSNKTIEMRKDIVKRIMDIAKQNKPQKK